MENQHRKISGYRDLNQAEIDLMNRIKEKEAEVLALHAEVEQCVFEQISQGPDSQEWHRANDAQAIRWLNAARDDLETGFMKLVRAVAQPQPKANKGK